MATWAGCAVRRMDTVDSTNRQARLWAREGAAHGAVVIAQAQTAGRGRRGRGWVSSPGAGLWLSIVLRPAFPPPLYPRLPLAAALAAADACQTVCGVPPRIKWPNDLLLHGRKIAGILAEGESSAVVLGIGINVRQRAGDFPPELAGTAGSLEMLTGRTVPLPALEAALLDALEARVDNPDFLQEYAARCATIGTQVLVAAPEETYAGYAEGIDEAGALLVRDAAGVLRRVLAGDVTIRALAGGYA